MSARVRGAGPVTAALLTVVVLVTGACSGGRGGAVPDPPADVTGVVSDVDSAAGPALTGASDDYYEGMALLSEETMVVGTDGREAPPESLEPGADVEVWVADECEESSPVRCVVEVVRIVG
ncbi:hypothetical protein [Isoptericola chiayiensis]|nr:hypothetical protein [Isoptericola chiayiensis]NOV99262.1 hypothetical protein [Isoptericola chiayiensis]